MAQPASPDWRGQLARDPASLEARYGLAMDCLAQGDASTAIAWLSDAWRVAPQDRAPAVRLGELLCTQQLHAQARAVYERLYGELGDRDRGTLLRYGQCLQALGIADEAAALFREAATREPGLLEAHVQLADVLWRVGDFDGSLAHAEAAVHLAPGHADAVRSVGAALLRQGRLQEAEEWLRRALALQPALAPAQADLGLALLLAGRLHEGWELLESIGSGDVPVSVPLLRPSNAQRSSWENRLAPWLDEVKIGLAWSGDPGDANHRNRATALSEWQALWERPEVQCFSLQQGDGAGFTDARPAPEQLLDMTMAWQDDGDMAAMLSRLDLVITVDPRMAHVAGTHGVHVWMLLAPNPDFQWLVRADGSPFHRSMRLFPRERGEARQAQVARVLAALDGWLAGRA